MIKLCDYILDSDESFTTNNKIAEEIVLLFSDLKNREILAEYLQNLNLQSPNPKRYIVSENTFKNIQFFFVEIINICESEEEWDLIGRLVYLT